MLPDSIARFPLDYYRPLHSKAKSVEEAMSLPLQQEAENRARIEQPRLQEQIANGILDAAGKSSGPSSPASSAASSRGELPSECHYHLRRRQ